MATEDSASSSDSETGLQYQTGIIEGYMFEPKRTPGDDGSRPDRSDNGSSEAELEEGNRVEETGEGEGVTGRDRMVDMSWCVCGVCSNRTLQQHRVKFSLAMLTGH